MDDFCGFCGKRNSLPPYTRGPIVDGVHGTYIGNGVPVECSFSVVKDPTKPCQWCEKDSSECCSNVCSRGAFLKLPIAGTAQGQQTFTFGRYSTFDRYKQVTTYKWIAPAGVTHVSVVAVGGGGSSGGGGGLGWKNNIPVIAGQSYDVAVGGGGATGDADPTPAHREQGWDLSGGDSYFISLTTVKGGGGDGFTGVSYTSTGYAAGGDFVGDGGGNGGRGSGGGAGGGAGGYSGNGGDGADSFESTNGKPGEGGGGGGGGLHLSELREGTGVSLYSFLLFDFFCIVLHSFYPVTSNCFLTSLDFFP